MKEGYDPKYGARPIRRVIQKRIEDAVAHMLIRSEIGAGDTVEAVAEEGRVAVRKSWRGRHLGYRLLQDLEEKLRSMGIHSVVLSAQVRVQAFYSYCGYLAEGVPYDDEGCPHITMRKFL